MRARHEASAASGRRRRRAGAKPDAVWLGISDAASARARRRRTVEALRRRVALGVSRSRGRAHMTVLRRRTCSLGSRVGRGDRIAVRDLAMCSDHRVFAVVTNRIIRLQMWLSCAIATSPRPGRCSAAQKRELARKATAISVPAYVPPQLRKRQRAACCAVGNRETHAGLPAPSSERRRRSGDVDNAGVSQQPRTSAFGAVMRHVDAFRGVSPGTSEVGINAARGASAKVTQLARINIASTYRCHGNTAVGRPAARYGCARHRCEPGIQLPATAQRCDDRTEA